MTIGDQYNSINTECVVALNGTIAGNGTVSLPLTWSSLMNLYDSLWPGVSILMRQGVYNPVGYINISGNPQGNMLIQPYNDENVYIDGSIYLRNDYVTLKSLNFINSNYNNRISIESGSNPSDINVTYRTKNDANNGKIINCIIHDSSTLVFNGGNNFEISDCILYYGGWVAPDRGHGHGVYVNGDTIKIKNCIIFDNFGFGVHCYGVGFETLLKNIIIENCIIFGSGEILSGFSNPNILVGGTDGSHADRPIINNCSIYHRLNVGSGIQIGEGAYGYDGGIVTNNIIAGGNISLSLVGEHVSPLSDISGNWFGSSISGVIQSDWPNNTYSSGIPDLVKVYPSEYDNNLAHVAVYNGSMMESVVINLSNIIGLSAGDNVSIANVCDLFVDIITSTLDVTKSIIITMKASDHTVAIPQGWNALSNTFPKFGCFVIKKI